MPSLRFLFLEVFKLRATDYGGPAMIGQIKETAVNQHAWVKEAEEFGMSYRHAWGVVKKIEKRAGFKIVDTRLGGKEGGGARLTPKGKTFVCQADSQTCGPGHHVGIGLEFYGGGIGNDEGPTITRYRRGGSDSPPAHEPAPSCHAGAPGIWNRSRLYSKAPVDRRAFSSLHSISMA